MQNWAAAHPPWAEIRVPHRSENIGLHRGETDAIALAVELKAFAVLLDDAGARRVAAHKSLATIGTIGILEAAAERGFIHLNDAIQRLSRTNFRATPEVWREALERDAGRRGKRS